MERLEGEFRMNLDYPNVQRRAAESQPVSPAAVEALLATTVNDVIRVIERLRQTRETLACAVAVAEAEG